MHRVIRTLLVGSAVLAAAACGTAADSGSTTTAASAPAANTPPGLGSTCEALAQVYGKNMAPYAQALTDLVADRKKVEPAQQALAAFATAVQDATKASEDAQLRAEGKKTADQMRAKSEDAKYFRTIKTAADVDKAMGPTLSEWLSPVSSRCS